MNNCLWCDTELVNQLNWYTFINGTQSEKLCSECFGQLEFINDSTCTKCFRKSTNKICNDCEKWIKYFDGKDPLIKNVSTFAYNQFMKEVVAKWKYRGDYLLGEIFKNYVQRTIYKHYRSILKTSIIVPVPLSDERLHERCFNQSLIIAMMITDNESKIHNIVSRIHSEKQSKKSRSERLFTKNPFKLNKTINKTVILVDDIYTTGTTLRHAASLLLERGCPAVYSYTLIRG